MRFPEGASLTLGGAETHHLRPAQDNAILMVHVNPKLETEP
jgi:hypothetical protein